MTTLKELVDQYGANGFVYADRGNGSASVDEGEFSGWDEDAETEYGGVEMMPLDKKHISADGVECRFASEWMQSYDKNGFLTNYEYRIFC